MRDARWCKRHDSEAPIAIPANTLIIALRAVMAVIAVIASMVRIAVRALIATIAGS